MTMYGIDPSIFLLDNEGGDMDLDHDHDQELEEILCPSVSPQRDVKEEENQNTEELESGNSGDLVEKFEPEPNISEDKSFFEMDEDEKKEEIVFSNKVHQVIKEPYFKPNLRSSGNFTIGHQRVPVPPIFINHKYPNIFTNNNNSMINTHNMLNTNNQLNNNLKYENQLNNNLKYENQTQNMYQGEENLNNSENNLIDENKLSMEPGMGMSKKRKSLTDLTPKVVDEDYKLPPSKTPIIDAIIYCAIKQEGIEIESRDQNQILFKVTDYDTFYEKQKRVCSKQNPTDDESSRIKTIQRWFKNFPTKKERSKTNQTTVFHFSVERSISEDKFRKILKIIEKLECSINVNKRRRTK